MILVCEIRTEPVTDDETKSEVKLEKGWSSRMGRPESLLLEKDKLGRVDPSLSGRRGMDGGLCDAFGVCQKG